MMQRRAVLKGLMVGGVTLATPLAAHASRALSQPAEEHSEPETSTASPSLAKAATQDPRAPWALIAPLAAGSYVGFGWEVETLSQVRRGAPVLTLVHPSGERARVHLCRRNGQARGLTHTDHLDLLLMNGGDGHQPTSECIGRAVKTVAMRILGRERREGQRLAPSADLMSHTLRLRRFGAREISA